MPPGARLDSARSGDRPGRWPAHRAVPHQSSGCFSLRAVQVLSVLSVGVRLTEPPESPPAARREAGVTRLSPANLGHGARYPALQLQQDPPASAREVANPVHPSVVDGAVTPAAHSAGHFFERRTSETMRTRGSPKTCLNWPDGGLITLGAVGFTQTLRAEPIVSENQRLSRSERIRLTSR